MFPCRGGSSPETSAFDTWLASTASCVSNKRHVDMRALARPLAPEQGREDRDAVYMPVNRSATATPTRIGPPPGRHPAGR